MDPKKVLIDSGLSEKEATIYLALNRKNSQTALAISRETKLDRTVTYDTLEKLNAKGIVSVSIINNSKHFAAISPLEFLRQHKQQLASLADVMTELQKSTATHQETPCEFFSGKEGIRAMAREFIQTAKNYQVINLNKEFDDAFSYFTEQALRELNRRKVKEQAIIGKGNEPEKLQKGEYRILSEPFRSPVTTVIENDTVLFFIWQEPFFGIRIKNAALAKSQSEYFSFLWNMGKK